MSFSAAFISWNGLVLLGAGLLSAYVALLAVLLIVTRDVQVKALVRFVPDCLVLIKRLAGDPRLPRRYKLGLALLAGYLISPVDLIPDFLPGIGQVDDALAVALALRWVLRHSGSELIHEHWPGPPETLALLLRVIGDPAGRPG